MVCPLFVHYQPMTKLDAMHTRFSAAVQLSRWVPGAIFTLSWSACRISAPWSTSATVLAEDAALGLPSCVLGPPCGSSVRLALSKAALPGRPAFVLELVASRDPLERAGCLATPRVSCRCPTLDCADPSPSSDLTGSGIPAAVGVADAPHSPLSLPLPLPLPLPLLTPPPSPPLASPAPPVPLALLAPPAPPAPSAPPAPWLPCALGAQCLTSGPNPNPNTNPNPDLTVTPHP